MLPKKGKKKERKEKQRTKSRWPQLITIIISFQF